MTLEKLQSCMPQLPRERAELMLPHLCAAAIEWEINTPLRLAAFLAQIAVESGELKWFKELASGKAYNGRKDLGNTRPEAIRIAKEHGTTPGSFWKGHGPIQTTGYDNHKKAGVALGIDAVHHPELLATPEHGFRAAGFFWVSNKLNILADLGTQPYNITRILRSGRRRIETHPAFDVISFKVNGGWTKKDERRRYYRLARAAFGLEPWEDA